MVMSNDLQRLHNDKSKSLRGMNARVLKSLASQSKSSFQKFCFLLGWIEALLDRSSLTDITFVNSLRPMGKEKDWSQPS